MFTTQGVCDWCKKAAQVTRHDYIDGKYHHSCEDCQERAKLDVRQFNLEEVDLSNKYSAGYQAA
ncbi:hypothetical protein DI392_07450 [Vibrio albus]|uniref:Uncharacterized protein n=1 Tax=Vibrio albus TaxID=2200953 RepID=A0A2U3BB69_9VIBR|nr:hypothetical protein [Vibrio albus]PWI34027.1 hypothetical protein DI392_07450 [Vibrio albus]